MALKDLAVPALCIIGTLWVMRGCENNRRCVSYRPYTPAPQPQYRIYQEPVQEQPYYEYEVPAQQRIIRRRVIRRTYTPVVDQNYYYEY